MPTGFYAESAMTNDHPRIDWRKPGRKERLQELILDGKSNTEIVDVLADEWEPWINFDTVANARRRLGLTGYLENADNEVKVYKEDTLPDGDYMVSCDYHAPYYSTLWVNRLLAVARKFKIKKHIIAGDLLDQNYAKFHAIIDGEEKSSLDMERDNTDPMLKVLAWFDETILIRGNHEGRVSRMTDARIQSRHIIELFGRPLADKLVYSDYDRVNVGEDWLIVHPKSYSQISGSVAVRLAEKFHRHVLNAHGHFFALRWDRSGRYMGIDIGGLFQPDKVGYQSLSTSTHPSWGQGFCMIKNNHPYLFHSGTDWDFWLK